MYSIIALKGNSKENGSCINIYLYILLCTGGAYFVPYSFLFISNKFCNGGSGPSRVIKFLYLPSPPPLTVWALDLPTIHPLKSPGGLKQQTNRCIKQPMHLGLYSPVHNVLDGCINPLHVEVGGGWALEFS